MNTRHLSSDETALIVRQQEGHFCDCKAIEVAPAKLTRTISAFANADGGELFIGLDETKGKFSWRGFPRIEDANGLIQAVQGVIPIGSECRIEFFSSDVSPGFVAHMEVAKTREIVKTAAGDIYLRRSASNQPVRTSDQLDRLKLNKGLVSFEGKTISVPPSLITESESIETFMAAIVPHQKAENWLSKQLLILNGMPTVAGLVLFADEPQAALPKQCGIKVYRYRTTDDEGVREALEGVPLTIEGCAYNQIYEAVATTKRLVESIRRMTPTGLVEVEYPEETLHEIITNAVLHRDYSIPDDIHIRVFDNRIEVSSPGTLPGHITPENILDERFSRNGSIVRLINKFPNPPNQDVGEGLNTAFRAMNRLHLKEPRIEQKDNSVLVTIRHEQLASPEERILKFLETNETINNGDARRVCLIREDWRIRSLFKRMCDANILEKVPGSRTSNTAYRRRAT